MFLRYLGRSLFVVIFILLLSVAVFSQSEAVEIKIMSHPVHESAVIGGSGAEIDLSPELLEETGRIACLGDTTLARYSGTNRS